MDGFTGRCTFRCSYARHTPNGTSNFLVISAVDFVKYSGIDHLFRTGRQWLETEKISTSWRLHRFAQKLRNSASHLSLGVGMRTTAQTESCRHLSFLYRTRYFFEYCYSKNPKVNEVTERIQNLELPRERDPNVKSCKSYHVNPLRKVEVG